MKVRTEKDKILFEAEQVADYHKDSDIEGAFYGISSVIRKLV